jgi:hypothetical protein
LPYVIGNTDATVSQTTSRRSVAALQSQQAMFRKNQPLISGFEWIIILFVGVIPFRAAEVVAEALGYSHVIALAGGVVVMAICVLAYFAIRPMMLPD